MERKKIYSECLLKLDINEKKCTILFSTTRYNNIVYYSTEKEIIYVYSLNYRIYLYDINTFKLVGSYEFEKNKNSCYVFEVCGDFLFVYDKHQDRGYVTRFNIAETDTR
jgi:hypothetical protein